MHILIVDDEINIRGLIRKYAIFEGYQVAEAANGLEAIEMCRKGSFDLIVMDVMTIRLVRGKSAADEPV